jgi:hypothetical protein
MIDYRKCAMEILPPYEYRERVKSDYFKVKKNFNNVLDTLGEFDKNELIVNIDLRLMNKYGNRETVESVCNAIWIKSSQYFLRRKSKYRKLPFVRSIETKEQARGRIKEHAHIMIRLKDLKKHYEEHQVIDIITDICYDMEEVNSKDRKKDKPPVNVRTFPFWEDNKNTLGKRIVYICKTSTQHMDPLINGLHKN